LKRRFATIRTPLQMAFDSEATITSPSVTGLFGYNAFQNPQQLTRQAEICIQQATGIVDLICTSGERHKVVKRVDTISDIMCCVLDASELIRNVHPDERWVEAATNAYALLHNFLNQLNTNQGLYDALVQVVTDPMLSKQLNSQQLKVASLLLADFEKSGIHMPSKQRARFVKLNDELQELGQNFSMNAFPSQETIVFDNPNAELVGASPKLIEALINASSSRSCKNRAIVPTNSEIANYILRSARDPETRRRIFMAMNSGSEGQIQVLESLLKTRAELASLLGKESYSRMYLVDKMASTPSHVSSFLEKLAVNNRQLADYEVNKLWELKRVHTGLHDPITAWYFSLTRGTGITTLNL
jgi:mitochondrial intermediate peptidase